jgi:hypothetical protein
MCIFRQSCATTTAATVMERRTASGAAISMGDNEGQQRDRNQRFAKAEGGTNQSCKKHHQQDVQGRRVHASPKPRL